jgi:hypothetical protein
MLSWACVSQPRLLQRTFSALQVLRSDTIAYSSDFKLWPSFLSPPEQRILLTAALQKLDLNDTAQTRRRRRAHGLNLAMSSVSTKGLQELFFPDHCYDFQEVVLREILLFAQAHFTIRDIMMESYDHSAKWLSLHGQPVMRGLTPS